jgi:hypothetical protein
LASIKELKDEDAARLAWSESFLYEVSKVRGAAANGGGGPAGVHK